MQKKQHLFDDPKNVRRLILGLFVTCGVILALDLFIHRHLSFEEGVFGAEGWFGFYGVYGFVACVFLVLIAKEMRKVLMRSEDYYDPPPPEGER